MGILNVTPDSFSDGGRWVSTAEAVSRGWELVSEGCDVLDVGGESTRPGAQPLSIDEEMERVIPVIERLSQGPVPVSVDTRHPHVMKAALEAGASLVNDVQALQAPGALEICAKSGVAVCLMHMKGEPRSMQQDPVYGDVLKEVSEFLALRATAAERAGIPGNRIILDPGFGFGKSLPHNLVLLKGLDRLRSLGYPLLVGLSRKSMLAAVTGRPSVPAARLGGSIAAALLALQRGAWMLRVHDVTATVQAVALWKAIEGQEPGESNP